MTQPIPIVGRGYCYEDLRVGFRFRTHRRTIAEADVASFINLTWLTEELFAVADDASRAIKGRPVPGAMVYAFAEARLTSKGDRGLVRFANEVKNQRGEVVLACDPLRMLKRK